MVSFVFGWGLPSPIIESHRNKNGCGHGLGEVPKMSGSLFNISATAEDSDFKFNTQLGFAKAHQKSTPRGKSGCGLGLVELPRIVGFPLIFLQRLELATSNLVHSFGLPRPIIKSHP